MPSRSFPAFPGSVPDARRYVGDVLGHLPAEAGETVSLLVSELATNAVRHAGGQFVVAAEYTAEDGRVWIGVTDTSPGLPVPRTPAVTAEGGRGMQLVGALADRWGVRRRRGTEEKTVWFELTAGPGPAMPGAG